MPGQPTTCEIVPSLAQTDRLLRPWRKGLDVNPAAESDKLHWIILFDSIHFVLAAEQAFKEHGVWCDLVPVPRDLSADCGMALEFRKRDLAAVRNLLADPRVRPRNVYQPFPGGHKQVTTRFEGVAQTEEED